MADEHDDPTHNIGADPLTATPGAGRGGNENDPIPEQIADAERTTDTEHRFEEETQEERGAAAPGSPGHVSSPEEMSEESKQGHP
ncbi:MAG: hypothetical protein JF887_07150 [Candidatus Dormibacteraeota bacterium]|uniref:Uncharacterized protein n=1 Tax=Candidatus Amunia macphersoniae TaxID=3127014 RepID=A0A934KNV8_9BACT|nr:hypothetical protein [Candidatus Dormibacteraeota bacterium]